MKTLNKLFLKTAMISISVILVSYAIFSVSILVALITKLIKELA